MYTVNEEFVNEVYVITYIYVYIYNVEQDVIEYIRCNYSYMYIYVNYSGIPCYSFIYIFKDT